MAKVIFNALQIQTPLDVNNPEVKSYYSAFVPIGYNFYFPQYSGYVFSYGGPGTVQQLQDELSFEIPNTIVRDWSDDGVMVDVPLANSDKKTFLCDLLVTPVTQLQMVSTGKLYLADEIYDYVKPIIKSDYPFIPLFLFSRIVIANDVSQKILNFVDSSTPSGYSSNVPFYIRDYKWQGLFAIPRHTSDDYAFINGLLLPFLQDYLNVSEKFRLPAGTYPVDYYTPSVIPDFLFNPDSTCHFAIAEIHE